MREWSVLITVALQRTDCPVVWRQGARRRRACPPCFRRRPTGVTWRSWQHAQEPDEPWRTENGRHTVIGEVDRVFRGCGEGQLTHVTHFGRPFHWRKYSGISVMTEL